MFDILIEFIGVFVFIGTILIADAYYPAFIQPILAVIALLAMIYFGRESSGGHFNPAITTVIFIKGGIRLPKYLLYMTAQILGGISALYWVKHMIKESAEVKGVLRKPTRTT